MDKVLFPQLKIYVGCALTYASEEFKTEVEIFKQELRKICEVLCFISISEDTPYAVYYHDIHRCVMVADLVVAVADHPSTGLGYEMATQSEARKKPLLVVAHVNSLVSDLIMDTQQPGFQFMRYKNLHDVIPVIQGILSGIWSERNDHPLFQLHLIREEGVA